MFTHLQYQEKLKTEGKEMKNKRSVQRQIDIPLYVQTAPRKYTAKKENIITEENDNDSPFNV